MNKITVCIATYNGQKYISKQLISILNQLKESDEVIISDDGSNDETLKIIEELKDNRIKVCLNVLKKGVTHNFENALNKATGDIIFLSDQDDIWLSNKIEMCVNSLAFCDLVVSDCKVVNDNEEVIYESYFKIWGSKKGFFKNFYRSSYLGCCLAFKKEILNLILPVPNNLYLFHDWWIGFLADNCCKVSFLDVPCMLYRRHNNNMSTTTSKSSQTLYKKLRDRFQLLLLGSIRIIKYKLAKKNVI